MSEPNFKEAFLEEAKELLSELEETLLELEDNPNDKELVNTVFRNLHTLKGSGAMFGFDNISEFTHEAETLFSLILEGNVKINKEIIDLALASKDHIRILLEGSGDEKGIKERSEFLVSLIKEFMPETSSYSAEPEKEEEDIEVSENIPTYRIQFKPAKDIYLTGSDPLMLIDELREMGFCSVKSFTHKIPNLNDMNPEYCYFYWDIYLTASVKINEIKDVFIFVEDESDIQIDIIDDGSIISEDEDYKRLGEILVDRGDMSPEELIEVLEVRRMFGKAAVELNIVSEDSVESALLEQKHVRTIRKTKSKTETASSIRVASDKLDNLVDLVGELVTLQARLNQLADDLDNANLFALAEESERLVWDLRDKAMSIRMVPIGTTFSKFKRLIRDLSAELGKSIELETEGAETELDKTIIEKLNDPMVHLIRNCVDHGIETPSVRAGFGKDRTGTIKLKAVHSGANVLIKISDDGKGIDKEIIRKKAVEKGLIQETANLTEKEIFSLIFEPGFSTAENVTNVSGRGVGMDVVRKNIEELRGSIDIVSKKNKGTEITVKLPLTLAIIDGLLVKIDDRHMVIPLAIVEECIEISGKNIDEANGRQIVNIRGKAVPYIDLRNEFEITGKRPVIEQAVIVNHEEKQVGFVVDDVVGEHQTVIKSLGKFYKNVEGISGATILGDGEIALILDIPHLFSGVYEKELSR